MSNKNNYPTVGITAFEKEVKNRKKYKILDEETYKELASSNAFKRKAIINKIEDLDKYIICSYVFTRTKLSSQLSYDRNKRKTPKYKYLFPVSSANNRSKNITYYYYKLTDIIDLITPELCS